MDNIYRNNINLRCDKESAFGFEPCKGDVKVGTEQPGFIVGQVVPKLAVESVDVLVHQFKDL